MTDQTYAAHVAADVAARYGVPVPPGAIQVIPRGVSGNVLPVWNGKDLVYSEASRISWRKQRATSLRNRTKSPAAVDRQIQIATLHAEGLHDAAIAETLNVAQSTVIRARAHLHLSANPCKDLENRSEARNGQIRALIAQGFGADAVGAELGLTAKYVRKIARELGVSFGLRPKPAAKPAPKLQAVRVAKIKPPRLPKQRQVRTPRAVVPKPPRPLSIAKQRRAALSAMIADLGRDLTRADLDQHGQAHGTSVKQMRRDMEILQRPWPRVVLARKSAVVRMSAQDRRAAKAARRSAIAAMDLTNVTVADLAKTFSVSDVTIGVDLRNLGKRSKVRAPVLSGIAKQTYEANQAKISALHADGKGWAEIKLATGLSSAAISRHLKVLGLSLPRGYVDPWANRPRPGMTDRVKALRKQISSLRAEGKTYAEIMAATGLSKASVSLHLREMGLTGPQGTQAQRVAA